MPFDLLGIIAAVEGVAAVIKGVRGALGNIKGKRAADTQKLKDAVQETTDIRERLTKIGQLGLSLQHYNELHDASSQISLQAKSTADFMDSMPPDKDAKYTDFSRAQARSLIKDVLRTFNTRLANFLDPQKKLDTKDVGLIEADIRRIREVVGAITNELNKGPVATDYKELTTNVERIASSGESMTGIAASSVGRITDSLIGLGH